MTLIDRLRYALRQWWQIEVYAAPLIIGKASYGKRYPYK